jgi:nucleotide-binding universal stress UspA family protein
MKVLTGIDPRVEGHEWLITRAAAFAARLGATLDVVFVRGNRADRDVAEIRAALTAKLHNVPESQRGVARVEDGDVVDTLVKLGTEYDALVVGPRLPTGLAALLEGPIASRVLRRATVPVFVPHRDMLREGKLRVLGGVDLEGDIPQATTVLAGHWARRIDGVLDLVYATGDRPVSARDALARKTAEREWREAHESTRLKLEGVLMHAPETVRGVARVEPGEPDDVMVSLSSEYDLVLVGNRDREGLSRFVLGPVASTVVKGASCDVLTLPTLSLGQASG